MHIEHAAGAALLPTITERGLSFSYSSSTIATIAMLMTRGEQMDAHTLIALFGQETGIPMALSEAGTVSLAFEVGPTVQLEYDPMINGLQCYVVLGQAPADQPTRNVLFRRMLAANVFGCDTDGAILGLDETRGDLILSRCMDLAHADTASLRAILESMVPLALDWQRRLIGPTPDGDEDVWGGGGTRRLPDPTFGLQA